MAIIGFFPVHEPSHVGATFGLARSLKSRGHYVRYLAPLDFQKQIEGQGMDFIPFCPDILPIGTHQQILDSPKTEGKVWRKIFDKLESGEFDAELKASGIDLLVVDTYAQHLAMIAHKIGMPAVLLSPTLPFARDSWLPPWSKAWVPNSLAAKLKIRLWWCKYDIFRLRCHIQGKPPDHEQSIKSLARTANYPLSGVDTTSLYPLLTLFPELILSVKEFDLPRTDSRSNIHYIGPFVDLQRKEDIAFDWSRIDESKPLIYCSLGTLSHKFERTIELLKVVIDAFRERPDYQLLMSIGTHLKIGDLQPVPSNVVLVNKAPQIEVLKKASLLITHGGLNSIKESILLGVPMIVLPWSKPVNGVRVVYHGLGLMGDVEKISVGEIQTMVDAINRDPSFKARVEAMRKIFIAAENADLGVKIIESILKDGNSEAFI